MDEGFREYITMQREKTKMSQNYKLTMKYPTSWWGERWREALPLGNGIMGASVYGGVWDETIMITHTDLWWKSKTPDLPDVSDCVSEIREKLLNHQVKEADAIMVDALKSKGYNPVLAYPLPLCDLKMETETKYGFKNYLRTLDMENGEAIVEWSQGEKEFVRKCFTSRADNCLVLKMNTKDNSPFSVKVSVDKHDVEDAKAHTDNLEEFLPKNHEYHVNGNVFMYAATNDDGKDYGCVAIITNKGGEMIGKDSAIELIETTELTILLQVFVQGNREIDLERIYANLENISGITRVQDEKEAPCLQVSENSECIYEQLLEKHVVLHQQYFKSTTLTLDEANQGTTNEELLLDAYGNQASTEMIEKLWNYGKYLLVSASRTGGNPCHLYGLWCGDYCGEWSFNMANENLQMIYWQALSGNMPELLLPVFEYIERLMPDFRTNAKNLYGCRGVFIPGPTVPDSGLIKNVSPHLLYWTGGAGWIGQHYYDYYLFTKDEEFLAKRALPYLEEVALFYEDFFVETENGTYMSIPSNSPENSPSNFCGQKYVMGGQMETAINATMDFAIAKEVLTNLLKGYEILGIRHEKTEQWKDMLGKIPPYEINEDGAIKEWMHDYFVDNYKHRHQSHIYPLFPGNEIHREDNEELYEAFVVAVKKRLQIGINQQTGWSLSHMSNNYARMREGELALECLDLMCSGMVMNNFMTLHNDWKNMGIGVIIPLAPVQLDANMGLTSAINEMLLQSYDNKILILPALPDRLHKGKIENLLTRQGITVSIEWDRLENKIVVELSNQHREIEVELIFPTWYQAEQKQICVTLEKNENKII